jgi:hypothetical protein
MSAMEALRAARALGVELTIEGNDLLLEAAREPPATTVEALARHKAEIIKLLRPSNGAWSPEDWQLFFEERAAAADDGGLPRADAEAQAFESCVVNWLNRNPAPSVAGRCAWCDQSETHGAVIVPYGIEPGTHAWLHAECWPAWHEFRRFQAKEVLTRMGILADACSVRGDCSPSKDASHQPRTQNV